MTLSKCIVALVLVGLCDRSAIAEPQGSSYRITQLAAHLYVPGEGKADAEDALSLGGHYWNRIEAGVLLVEVTLEGPQFGSRTAGTLQVTVREGGRPLLDQRVRLRDFFTEKPTLTLPFLAYGGTCTPMQVVTTLRDAHARVLSRRSGRIPLRCGE